MARRILVVEDESAIADSIAHVLTREGFEVRTAEEGEAALHLAEEFGPDLVLLDLMLPGLGGLDVCRLLRARSTVPIIMLTAKAEEVDRVVGLEMGADDYMSKPFEPRELVARIQSVLRRVGAPREAAPGHADVIAFDGWRLQRDERQLTSPKGVVVPLSNAEFQLLNVFLRAPRRVVSREQLAEQARGHTLDDPGRSIDLLVSRLRHKLAADGAAEGCAETEDTELIKTVRGAGYLFNVRSVQGATLVRQ
jgi:two-component system, OmpR family, response regulator